MAGQQHVTYGGQIIEPTSTRRSIVVAAVTIAALVVIVVGLSAASSLRDRTAPPDPFTVAAERFQAQAATSTDTCCESLTVTIGTDGTATSSEAEALADLLASLGFSRSTLDRMASTRALDGTQTDTSDRATAYWTYHPDNGLRVIFERS